MVEPVWTGKQSTVGGVLRERNGAHRLQQLDQTHFIILFGFYEQKRNHGKVTLTHLFILILTCQWNHKSFHNLLWSYKYNPAEVVVCFYSADMIHGCRYSRFTLSMMTTSSRTRQIMVRNKHAARYRREFPSVGLPEEEEISLMLERYFRIRTNIKHHEGSGLPFSSCSSTDNLDSGDNFSPAPSFLSWP